MKKHLLAEFVVTYLLLGVIGFFSITLVGSVLIEHYLENIISRNLNLEASSIAHNENILDAWRADDLEELEDNLGSIANYEDAIFWIIDKDLNIVLSAPEKAVQKISSDFHPETWRENAHQVGSFYGYFPSKRLSVLCPIQPDSQSIQGYVIVHYKMSRLYERRSGALFITQILFVIMYLFAYILVALYYFRVHRPLVQITKGASEYADGNLSYRIPIDANDEMGYLAKTLNYMSDTLNQNGQYQRQFVSNVSHDFRSPLTSIKGYVNAMLDGTIPPEYQDRYLKIIASETERLEKLTQSLLALNELDSKKRTLHKTRFDIHQLILEASAVSEGICREKKIELKFDLMAKDPTVLADKQQIQQVLHNLLDNAIKFSPENSSIRLETKHKGNRIFVLIEDHGCGIPKDSLNKIWTRFYKTDTSRGKDRKGTGLGLSIVKEIIRAHEQQIDVISTEGAGTEFIFTLEKA